eukprot:gene4551-4988_t
MECGMEGSVEFDMEWSGMVSMTVNWKMKPITRPIAQLLRAKRPRDDTNENKILPKAKILTLEEEIAKLEQEIGSDNSSDEEENSENDDESEKESDDSGDGLLINQGGILTSLKPELKIQPLPKNLLPAASCKFADKNKPHHQQQQNLFRPKKLSIADALTQASVASGLEKTIAEQLRNYQPASLEKKPFYCRVCKYQGQSIEELTNHKESESHRKAVELERKLSFCSLCRKQFTSPDQLQGHLEGKAHKERLEKVRGFSKRT